MDWSLAIPFLSTSDAVFLGRHMKRGGEKWRHIQSIITKETPVISLHLICSPAFAYYLVQNVCKTNQWLAKFLSCIYCKSPAWAAGPSQLCSWAGPPSPLAFSYCLIPAVCSLSSFPFSTSSRFDFKSLSQRYPIQFFWLPWQLKDRLALSFPV